MSVETSYHAEGRFRVRAGGDAANIEAAWGRGMVIDIPETAPVPQHDEARYDARSDVVIFRREGTLVTCYGLAPACLTSIHGIAVAAAVDQQLGTTYRSAIEAHRLEEVQG